MARLGHKLCAPKQESFSLLFSTVLDLFSAPAFSCLSAHTPSQLPTKPRPGNTISSLRLSSRCQNRFLRKFHWRVEWGKVICWNIHSNVDKGGFHQHSRAGIKGNVHLKPTAEMKLCGSAMYIIQSNSRNDAADVNATQCVHIHS